MSASVEPIQTLYINNLNDKLSKEQLKQSLYLLFSQFGTILDIVALKTERMRGQAWVSYLSVQNATDAMNKLQGFDFFGKPMKIQYAKTKSNAVERFEKALQVKA
ncbi:U2 small nuclear ribonucleoprotein B'' [Blastocystis sp. ATCC 50177/Nand II]|uniref:U2 small nuclear ribonucleoprotein B n=1 Tax=Blastocystis sp. subtype 1 (strain ATCC 50177 / NandII) TaxID=478820 RepID=A0A196SPM5_BLAHN|nr:U2 small nuclear ribonucleoprotein B'' [Blastocystis sp. ATCC 50177/Nand II]